MFVAPPWPQVASAPAGRNGRRPGPTRGKLAPVGVGEHDAPLGLGLWPVADL
jgi:hypothetical protein